MSETTPTPSGSPEWAVALGFGSPEESLERPLPVKLMAWSVHAFALTLVFWVVGAFTGKLTGVSDALRWWMVAVVVVAGIVVLLKLARRRTELLQAQKDARSADSG